MELALSLGLGIPGGLFLAGSLYRILTRPNGIAEADYEKLASAAAMSNFAYKDPEEYRERVQEFKSQQSILATKLILDPEFIEDESTDSQAYIWMIGETIYLSYRGTEHPKDILADLDMRTENINPEDEESLCCFMNNETRIHQGFHRQFFSIEPRVTASIDGYIQSGATSLFICGHSLGGALASVATYYYSKKYSDIEISTVTFGSPRVGNDIFAADECHSRTIRVYNFHDPIAMIPFSYRFEHTHCQSLCLDDSADLFCNHRLSTEYKNGDIYWILRPSSWFRLNIWAPISPHSSRRYRDTLIRISSRVD